MTVLGFLLRLLVLVLVVRLVWRVVRSLGGQRQVRGGEPRPPAKRRRVGGSDIVDAEFEDLDEGGR